MERDLVCQEDFAGGFWQAWILVGAATQVLMGAWRVSERRVKA